jgi:hypothetical protein
MRTLGFRTHALVALAAAIGVIAALGRPWYAAPPAVAKEGDVGEFGGSVEGLGSAIGRWIRESGGTTGWDALGGWGTALAVLAAVAAAGALGCLVPALQGVAREALRYGGLAMFGIAVWKLIDTPGPNAVMEPRFGAFVAAFAALIAVTSGSAVAGAPLQRRRATAWASS